MFTAAERDLAEKLIRRGCHTYASLGGRYGLSKDAFRAAMAGLRLNDSKIVVKQSTEKPAKKRVVSGAIDVVIDVVCNYYSVERDEMISTSRSKSVTIARQIAIYLSVEFSKMSNCWVGKKFHRDHSTVYHALMKIHKIRATLPLDVLRALIAAELPRGQDAEQ